MAVQEGVQQALCPEMLYALPHYSQGVGMYMVLLVLTGAPSSGGISASPGACRQQQYRCHQ